VSLEKKIRELEIDVKNLEKEVRENTRWRQITRVLSVITLIFIFIIWVIILKF